MLHNFQMSESSNVVIFLFSVQMFTQMEGKWLQEAPFEKCIPLELLLPVSSWRFPSSVRAHQVAFRLPEHRDNDSLLHCLKSWLLYDSEHLTIVSLVVGSAPKLTLLNSGLFKSHVIGSSWFAFNSSPRHLRSKRTW